MTSYAAVMIVAGPIGPPPRLGIERGADAQTAEEGGTNPSNGPRGSADGSGGGAILPERGGEGGGGGCPTRPLLLVRVAELSSPPAPACPVPSVEIFGDLPRGSRRRRRRRSPVESYVAVDAPVAFAPAVVYQRVNVHDVALIVRHPQYDRLGAVVVAVVVAGAGRSVDDELHHLAPRVRSAAPARPPLGPAAGRSGQVYVADDLLVVVGAVGGAAAPIAVLFFLVVIVFSVVVPVAAEPRS